MGAIVRHPKHPFSDLAKRYEAQNLEAAQRILADPKADPKTALVKWAQRIMDRHERAESPTWWLPRRLGNDAQR